MLYRCPRTRAISTCAARGESGLPPLGAMAAVLLRADRAPAGPAAGKDGPTGQALAKVAHSGGREPQVFRFRARQNGKKAYAAIVKISIRGI